LNAFNTYKEEEEKQHEIIRSDIGKEYYGRYTQKVK
jgi:hypothetical protein